MLTDPKAAVAKGAQQVFEQLLRAKPQAESPNRNGPMKFRESRFKKMFFVQNLFSGLADDHSV